MYQVKPHLFYFFGIDFLVPKINFFQNCFNYIKNSTTDGLIDLYISSLNFFKSKNKIDIYEFFKEQFPENFSINFFDEYSLKNKNNLEMYTKAAIEWVNLSKTNHTTNKGVINQLKNKWDDFITNVQTSSLSQENIRQMERITKNFNEILSDYNLSSYNPSLTKLFYLQTQNFLLYYVESHYNNNNNHSLHNHTVLMIIRQLISKTNNEFDHDNNNNKETLDKLNYFFQAIDDIFNPIMTHYNPIQLYETLLISEAIEKAKKSLNDSITVTPKPLTKEKKQKSSENLPPLTTPEENTLFFNILRSIFLGTSSLFSIYLLYKKSRSVFSGLALLSLSALGIAINNNLNYRFLQPLSNPWILVPLFTPWVLLGVIEDKKNR